MLFGSYTLALVEKYNLEAEYWKQSFDLVLHLIEDEADLLIKEFFSKIITLKILGMAAISTNPD